MSKASEYAAMLGETHELANKLVIRWGPDNCYQASVDQDGDLELIDAGNWLGQADALALGRWLVETFGDEGK